MNTHIVEPVFGLNHFQKPKTIEDEEALAKTILIILFGRPGVFPSLPNIGMHIQDIFYKFEDEIDVTALKVKLATQCSLITELENSKEFDMQLIEDDDGKLVLLIMIPVVREESKNMLVIGVTTNDSKSVIYNFDLIQTDFYNE